jgi:hypothetical protein
VDRLVEIRPEPRHNITRRPDDVHLVGADLHALRPNQKTGREIKVLARKEEMPVRRGDSGPADVHGARVVRRRLEDVQRTLVRRGRQAGAGAGNSDLPVNEVRHLRLHPCRLENAALQDLQRAGVRRVLRRLQLDGPCRPAAKHRRHERRRERRSRPGPRRERVRRSTAIATGVEPPVAGCHDWNVCGNPDNPPTGSCRTTGPSQTRT